MTPKIDNESAKCCSGRLVETCQKNTPQKYCNMGAKGPKSDPQNEHKIIKNPTPGSPWPPVAPRGHHLWILAPFWHHFRSTFDGIWTRSRNVFCRVLRAPLEVQPLILRGFGFRDLPIHPQIHPSIHQSTPPSTNPPLNPPIHPSIHKSTPQSTNPPLNRSIHP